MLVKRDGKRCWYCKPDPSRKWRMDELVLHHVDNNPENNPRDGSNWKLACYSHNHRLNTRGPSKYHPARGMKVEDLRTSQPQTIEMKRNLKARPLFEEYLRMCIDEDGEVDVDDIIGFVCREANVVQSTVQRYIDIMVMGKNAPYYLDKEDNVIKPHKFTAEPEAVEVSEAVEKNLAGPS